MEKMLPQKASPIVRLSKVFILLLVCFTGHSCVQSDVYSEFRSIEKEEWSKSNILTYVVDTNRFEVGKPYRLTIELMHSTNYLYQNLYLYINSDLDDKSPMSDQARLYELCDNKGKWFGSGFGSLYQLSLPCQDTIIFKDKRNYKFTIQHAMRDEPLFGIDKVGLTLEKIQ